MDLSYLYNNYNLESACNASTGLVYYDKFNEIYHNVSYFEHHELYHNETLVNNFISTSSINKKVYSKAIKNIHNVIDGKSNFGCFYHPFYIDGLLHYRIILESCQILLDKNKNILDILSPKNHTSFRKYKSIKKKNKTLRKNND